MEKLSVVIIAFNEERNIARCIQSVAAIADEILVVDSFSSDRTEEICRKFKVRFEQHTFEGYTEQKNYALSRSTHPIILSLDADEALTDLLTDSIKQALMNWTFNGYTMNRLTNYCGKWIKHSWYPDRQLRLFNRNFCRWESEFSLHEKIVLQNGNITGHLKGDLLHYSFYSVEEHRKKIEKFANIASQTMHKKGISASFTLIFLKPVSRFIKFYFLKLGFLDGKEGLIIAYYSAREAYLKYRNLYRLQRNSI